MLTLSFLTFALCVTSSFAQQRPSCKDGHGTGFYPNKFFNNNAAYDTSGTVVDSDPAVGNSITVTTTNTFGELWNTQLTVFDVGVIAAGTPTNPPEIAGYSGPAGSILNQAFITAVWFTNTVDATAEIECNHIRRSDEINVNGELIGSKVCLLERMEEDILAWDYYYTHKPTPEASSQPIQVDELLVCTWKTNGNGPTDGTMWSQVAIGFTSAGDTFAILFAGVSGNQFAGFRWFKFNGNYASAADATYAHICATSIASSSNLFCGKKSSVMFSLNSRDQCTASDSCSDLHSDYYTRKPNCNDLNVPADTCYAQGQCTYTYNANDAAEILFTFRFEDEIVTLDSWEAVDVVTTLSTGNAVCVFAPGEISADDNNDVTITKTWTSQDISDCGATITNGEYQILLHNYDSNEFVNAAMNGNHVWKMGSRQYLVTCRPADLITEASIGVTVGGDVLETTMPTIIPTITLQFGNKLNYKQAGFDVFTTGQKVAIGRPLFPTICYTPGANWVENVHPYGVRGYSCEIGNTAAFDDKVMTVILASGCTNDALKVFKSGTSFVSLNIPSEFGGKFCASMGAIRAARWRSHEEIYFRCKVEFCTNTAYYDSSYCKNSCDTVGNGYNADGNRKKRQAEEEDSVTVQTVIRISDTTEMAAQTSCADLTMAIPAIVALVVLLLVTTVITVFLMLKDYLTQLVLVYTDQGNTYSLMYENAAPFQPPTLRWVGNGNYHSTANPVFATVCDAGNGLNLAGLANSFCGKKDGVMWSLAAAKGCTDTAICANLDVNLEARNNNCNELMVPADSCHINGTCQYVTPLNVNFRMSFVFSKEVVDYANWAVLETVAMTLASQACIVASGDVVDNGDDTYTVTKEFPNGVAGTCNIVYNAGTGEYTILLLNYDANEAQAATTPTWRGDEIYKAGYRMYQIKCRPDDLPASLVQGVTIGNDIYETTVDATSDRTLTVGFGTMLDGTDARFTAFAAGATVRLGTPLFPYVDFNPGSQYVQNVVPYAVYVKECWIAYMADFSDKKRMVVQNRCRRINIGAFKLLDEIQGPALAYLTIGSTMRVVGGPIRAARWIDQTMIWLQCEVDFCTNTEFYTDSYCRNSCTGQGANAVGNRKRRDAEGNTSVILTTHIMISDEIESCVDSTLAIATLSALVVMLLVATVITVLLAVKLQNKKET